MGRLGDLLAHLGALCRRLGALLERLGAVYGPTRAIMENLLANLKPFWAASGTGRAAQGARVAPPRAKCTFEPLGGGAGPRDPTRPYDRYMSMNERAASEGIFLSARISFGLPSVSVSP